MPFIRKVRVRACYLFQDILLLGHCRLPICSFDPMTVLRVIRGHMSSKAFLPLTFDGINARLRKAVVNYLFGAEQFGAFNTFHLPSYSKSVGEIP